MRFHDPLWFWALAGVPALALASWFGARNSARAFENFVSAQVAPRLVPDGIYTRRRMRTAMLLISVCLLVVGLARPQYGVKPIEVKRSGIDLVIIMDTSKSMAAGDIKPSRMGRARNEIKKLVTVMEGNRIGLVTFAGTSFVECPLTMDTGAIRMFLDAVNVGAVPTPGTAIDKAIYDAIRMLSRSKAKTKAAVLVTDGENLSGDVAKSAESASKAGVKIFPIGVGSTAGAPVPEVDGSGKVTGYKTDANGRPVLTRLDVKTLETVARISGAELYLSRGGNLDLSDLIKRLKSMKKTDIASFEFTEYQERYQPVALLALLLLCMEHAIYYSMARRASPDKA